MKFKLLVISLLATLLQSAAVILFLGIVYVVLTYLSEIIGVVSTQTESILLIVIISVVFICGVVGNYKKLHEEDEFKRFKKEHYE